MILESELHKLSTGIYLLPSLPPDTVPMHNHSSSVCCICGKQSTQRTKTAVMEPQMERSKFFFAYSETQCILLKINIFETFLLEQKCYRLLTRRQNHPAAKHMNIFKDEGRLTPEFDIETSSGAGYLSSEMEMSLICLLKMLAAACKILLSSHIWATLLKS